MAMRLILMSLVANSMFVFHQISSADVVSPTLSTIWSISSTHFAISLLVLSLKWVMLLSKIFSTHFLLFFKKKKKNLCHVLLFFLVKQCSSLFGVGFWWFFSNGLMLFFLICDGWLIRFYYLWCYGVREGNLQGWFKSDGSIRLWMRCWVEAVSNRRFFQIYAMRHSQL